jgi:hypothetical protein
MMQVLDQVKALLGGDPEVDRKTLTVAVASGPTPQGAISPDIRYWNPETGMFETTVPTVYANQKLGVSVVAQNTGTAPQNMYLVAQFTAPDGTMGQVSSQLQLVQPGGGFEQSFYQDPPLQVGTYTIDIILMAELA